MGSSEGPRAEQRSGPVKTGLFFGYVNAQTFNVVRPIPATRLGNETTRLGIETTRLGLKTAEFSLGFRDHFLGHIATNYGTAGNIPPTV